MPCPLVWGNLHLNRPHLRVLDDVFWHGNTQWWAQSKENPHDDSQKMMPCLPWLFMLLAINDARFVWPRHVASAKHSYISLSHSLQEALGCPYQKGIAFSSSGFDLRWDELHIYWLQKSVETAGRTGMLIRKLGLSPNRIQNWIAFGRYYLCLHNAALADIFCLVSAWERQGIWRSRSMSLLLCAIGLGECFAFFWTAQFAKFNLSKRYRLAKSECLTRLAGMFKRKLVSALNRLRRLI